MSATPVTQGEQDVGAPGRAARLKRVTAGLPLLQLAALLALMVLIVIRIPAITNPIAISSVLVLASLLGIAAMGQTLIVLLGELDLAIPGYIAFGAFAASNLAGMMHWPLPLAIGLAVIVCAAFAGTVGYLCHKLSVQSLVVTLGTGAVLTGGTLFLSGGQFIAAPPEVLSDLTRVTATTFGILIPPVVVLWIVGAILLGLFLARTATGRRLYATGGNPRAAALARVNTRRVWTVSFAVNGALSAVAGVLIAGFSAGTSAYIGEPYLFAGIAAVLVGGTVFGSIKGSYTRTVIGALLLTLLSTILIGEGFTEGQSRLLYGVMILVVIAVYGRERRLRDRF